MFILPKLPRTEVGRVRDRQQEGLPGPPLRAVGGGGGAGPRPEVGCKGRPSGGDGGTGDAGGWGRGSPLPLLHLLGDWKCLSLNPL